MLRINNICKVIQIQRIIERNLLHHTIEEITKKKRSRLRKLLRLNSTTKMGIMIRNVIKMIIIAWTIIHQ